MQSPQVSASVVRACFPDMLHCAASLELMAAAAGIRDVRLTDKWEMLYRCCWGTSLKPAPFTMKIVGQRAGDCPFACRMSATCACVQTVLIQLPSLSLLLSHHLLPITCDHDHGGANDVTGVGRLSRQHDAVCPLQVPQAAV